MTVDTEAECRSCGHAESEHWEWRGECLHDDCRCDRFRA